MLPNNYQAAALPLRIALLLMLCCICLSFQAQETKTTVKGPSGKDVKIKKEPDKLKIKGEGAGSMMLDMDAVKTAIRSNNELFHQAIASADSAAMVDLYHSDAWIYPQGMKAMMRTGMGGMTRTMASLGIKGIQLTTSEVIGSGDLVVETGTYQMKGENGILDTGKYMVVWKQEGGRWKMYRDMWNSDQMSHQ